MGVKIIDLEYATLKSPDGHDRDFVYYHVCGADGKAKKNTKIPICEAAKHVCSNTDSNLGTLDSFLQAQEGTARATEKSPISWVGGCGIVSDSAACMIHCIDLDNIESDSHYTRPFPLLRSIHTFVENLVNECRAVRYKSNFPGNHLAVFQLLLHYEALTVLLQEHHQVWIPPTRTCEDCVFCRIVQTDSAMLRALAFSFTPFGRHVMTGIPFDRMKEIASYPASFEQRVAVRLLSIRKLTYNRLLSILVLTFGEYFETGESEDGDSGVEEDYTPAQREMRQNQHYHKLETKQSKKRRYKCFDIPIQKVKRRCSSADYSQSDIIGKQSQLERLLEETIGEEHDSDDSADSDEYQTCRTVIGETQWKHLLCVQLGLTIRQSIPGLDPKSILCVRLITLLG
ncbi:hypothetical protein BLNAU_9139 [Blattamonas nauphoetae]|uniref:Uncharacterized protein n=1 Tax=Blattamonas nauphoetae TaxID=2049346 RepID=A0ABQ9XWW5_9EUKA|nr:hypothetical protein BLNAU_9139 [Blattamonas nauphoetae]